MIYRDDGKTDLLMHEGAYDRSAAEYECKECFEYFYYKKAYKADEPENPMFCPLCGKQVDRVFDLNKGRWERNERRGCRRRRVYEIKGSWSVMVERKCMDDWGNADTEKYDAGLYGGFAWEYMGKLKRLVDTRKKYAEREDVISVEIIRNPPKHKPNLPQGTNHR